MQTIASLLRDTELADTEWLAGLNSGAEAAPDDGQAAFAALSMREVDSLIERRPAVLLWSLEHRQMTICEAIAHRLLTQEFPAVAGPLATMSMGPTWMIASSEPIPFTCTRELGVAVVGKMLGIQDVLTGDDDFDALASLEGPVGHVLDRMDAPRRAHWTDALRNYKHVGITTWLQAFEALPPPEGLSHLLTTMFVGPSDQPAHVRLTRRFETEPHGGVRARLLRRVLANARLPSTTRARLETDSVLDPDPRVRAVAGEFLWPAVSAVSDVTTLTAATLAVVLDRLSGNRRLAAVAHIGATGDETSISALVEAGSGFLKGRELRAATQAAIAEITTRVGGLRTGGLSVAEAAHGGLSTPDTDPDDR